MSLEHTDRVPFLVFEGDGRLGSQEVRDFEGACRFKADYANWAPATADCIWYVINARSVAECNKIIDARRAAAAA